VTGRGATSPVPAQLLVIAKEPVPGAVKTRLCPPCTPVDAARIAAAALADTIDVADRTAVDRRVLVLSGRYRPPPGWVVVRQRGAGLGERLAHAFADTARPGTATLLIGMDTPQVTPRLLAVAVGALARSGVDAVLGPADDGGWWALGLRDPRHAAALAGVTMSTARTGADTLAALRGRGLRVAPLPVLRDVDTAADAHAVARRCRPGRFTRAVAALVPVTAAPTGGSR
jgi:rSAM/selenodomain-associated transferase 1